MKNTLKRLNIGAALVQLVLAIGLIVWLSTNFDKEAAFPLESGEYQGNGQGRLIQKIPPQTLVILLIVFTLVTCLFHTLYSFDVGNYYKNVFRGSNFMRWIEYAITATIMIFVIAVSSGVYSLDSQVLIVVSCVACMLCGLVADEMQGPFNLKRTVTFIGWMLLLTAFMIIFRRFYAPKEMDPPKFVYAIVFCMCLLFISFGIVHIVHLHKKRRGLSERQNAHFEMAYTIDSMVSKSLLIGLLFGGLAAG